MLFINPILRDKKPRLREIKITQPLSRVMKVE